VNPSKDDPPKAALRAAELINFYWGEARKSWNAGARHAFCVFTAAALESALIAACTIKEAEIRVLQRRSWDQKKMHWPSDSPWEWKLDALIDAANVMSWAGYWDQWPTPPPNAHADLARMLHTLRDVRNWVHPSLIIRRGIEWPGVVPDLQMAVLGAFVATMDNVRPIIEDLGPKQSFDHLFDENSLPFRIKPVRWETQSENSE
jgi:hypothetical protein